MGQGQKQTIGSSFPPATVTDCYAAHLYLWRKGTPASVLILCPRKVPGKKGIYGQIRVNIITKSPFHKTLLVDIYSFHSAYWLI